MKKSLAFASLLLSFHAFALPAPLQAALDSVHADASTDWAYTRETSDGEDHYVERFDPAAPREGQWQLVEFNGDAPSEKELKRYRKDYDSHFERDSPTDVDFSTLMDPETVVLEKETDATLEYGFVPLAEGEEDEAIMPYLRGAVVVDRATSTLRSVRIWNTGEFKPAKVVKIKTLQMTIDLAPVSSDGPVFIARSAAVTEGRFMGLKKISESREVSFRDFAR